jgi:protein O-GlcNAc transferase
MQNEYLNIEILKKGSLLQNLGDDLEAEIVYKSAKNYFIDPNILNNLSLIELKRKNYWESEKLAWSACELSKEVHFIENFLVILAKTGQEIFAKNLIENWIEENNKNDSLRIYKQLKFASNNYEKKVKKNQIEKNVIEKIKEYSNKKLSKNKLINIIIQYGNKHKDKKDSYLNLAAEIEYKSNCLKESFLIYKKSFEYNKNNPDTLCGLGAICMRQNKFQEAKIFLEMALQKEGDKVDILANLGTIARYNNEFEPAIEYYKKAINLDNNNAELYTNLSVIYKLIGDTKENERLLHKSYILNPNNVSVLTNYSNLMSVKLNYGRAITMLRQANTLQKDKTILNNLGNLYQHYGEPQRAIEIFDAALKIDENYSEAHSNKLFTSNYDPNISPEQLIDLYKKYGTKFLNKKILNKKIINKSICDKIKINIGFVSGDYNNHPLFNFLSPIIEGLDKNNFNIYLYSNNPFCDIYTEWYKQRVKNFIPIWLLSDAELVEKVNSDEIDFLIDLSGHTAYNRLKFFGLNPINNSATWIGYNYSTGLSSIKYILTDEYLKFNNTEKFYSEKQLSLGSTAYCFRPKSLEQSKAINIPSSPFQKNGYITFGSFSRGIRINDEVIKNWAAILINVKNSRLRLDSRSFADLSVAHYFSNKFLKLGVEKNRIDFANTPFIEGINEVDIVLDSFPHNSGTTLYESVYFGKPFITLSTSLSIGRLGGSILSNLDMKYLIAHNTEEYINIAINLSNDRDLLYRIHQNISSKILNSEIMNEDKFVKNFENIIKKVIKLEIK